MPNGFRVDLQALSTAEQGVRDAVAELGEMGGWGAAESGKGSDGRGLAEYLRSGELTPEGVGHPALAASLVEFVDRWEWGVKFLVEDGAAAADALSDTRSTYEKAEDSATTALKRVAMVAVGNPLKSADSWDDHSASEVLENIWGQDFNGDGTTGKAGER